MNRPSTLRRSGLAALALALVLAAVVPVAAPAQAAANHSIVFSLNLNKSSTKSVYVDTVVVKPGGAARVGKSYIGKMGFTGYKCNATYSYKVTYTSGKTATFNKSVSQARTISWPNGSSVKSVAMALKVTGCTMIRDVTVKVDRPSHVTVKLNGLTTSSSRVIEASGKTYSLKVATSKKCKVSAKSNVGEVKSTTAKTSHTLTGIKDYPTLTVKVYDCARF